LAYAHLKPLQVFRPALVWLAQGFANFNEIFDWALAPFAGLARLAWRGLRALIPLAGPAAQSAHRADEIEHGKE